MKKLISQTIEFSHEDIIEILKNTAKCHVDNFPSEHTVSVNMTLHKCDSYDNRDGDDHDSVTCKISFVFPVM